MEKIKLSVVIPGYNEERNISKNVLKKVDDYLRRVNFNYEVLVVDDGSSDLSVQLIKSQIKSFKKFRLIENPHSGKALTVITGLLQSKGEIALFTDMDQSTPIAEIEKFFPKFTDGYDVVIGSRDGRKGSPLIRKLASIVFATLRTVILGLPFSDTQCGFKAFNRLSRETIFPKMKRYWESTYTKGAMVNPGFDVETLFLAKKAGFKITDMPVEWTYVQNQSYQLIKNAITAFIDILRIKYKEITGKYN